MYAYLLAIFRLSATGYILSSRTSKYSGFPHVLNSVFDPSQVKIPIYTSVGIVTIFPMDLILTEAKTLLSYNKLVIISEY